MRRNVFLIGMMAVGKSTVGRLVAAQMDLVFHDTDRMIEERAGADISWIFDREGEDGFRDREQQVLDELTGRSAVLVATGGGAIIRKHNRRTLRQRGVVVYLKSAPGVIVERTRDDRHRPLLQTHDLRGRVERLCREREPLYSEIAHIEVAVDHRSPKLVAEDIVGALALRGMPAHV